MIGFTGFTFMGDGNSLDPMPTDVGNLTAVTIQNAIYDDVYITQNSTFAYSPTPPADWDLYTILYANFEGTLVGGNIDAIVAQISSIKIKRRVYGTFEWTTIKEYPVNKPEDLSFVFQDYLGKNNETYEYAWVPVLNGNEGNYVVEEVLSKFNGVFIVDSTAAYKFYGDVSYGTSSQVQQVGVFTPLGQQYPVYVTNGALSYQIGSVSGKVMGSYEETHILDRYEMVKQKDAMLQFLTNKKPKILKDWNGNLWLVFITGSPTVTYNNSWGMGLMDIGFEYGEVGDANSTTDLQQLGFIPTVT